MYSECRVIKKKRKKRVVILTVFFFVLVFLFCHLVFFVNPTIKNFTEEKVQALATTAITRAAKEVITEVFDYDDLISVDKDSDGNITLIQTNSTLINVLTHNVTLKAQENISSLSDSGIEIPLGSMTGLTFLAGRGPSINLRLLPVGHIKPIFKSELIAKGINQTQHKISINLQADINVILPGSNNIVSLITPIVIAESIIVGKVPQFYFESNLLDNLLNLVP